MHILICGGAGYIGSHMAKMLADNGHTITIFDNLSTGHREAAKWGKFIQGDLLDLSSLKQLFTGNSFDAVMHFSAKSLVGESLSKPGLYYTNDVIGTLNLLNEMVKHGVDKFIFSSSAATYGIPQKEVIDESHPQHPINPYGQSKLMVEKMLQDFSRAEALSSVSLRYFNAAGADPDGEIGESHQPETHLIPNVLLSCLGKTSGLKIFGSDYPTSDGTCIRDYIHINDLCTAHLRSLEFLSQNQGAFSFNLGNGAGFSIFEIINAAESVTGKPIPYEVLGRREGDPPTLVANCDLAKIKLGWKTSIDTIESIIETAWKWHKNQPF